MKSGAVWGHWVLRVSTNMHTQHATRNRKYIARCWECPHTEWKLWPSEDRSVWAIMDYCIEHYAIIAHNTPPNECWLNQCGHIKTAASIHFNLYDFRIMRQYNGPHKHVCSEWFAAVVFQSTGSHGLIGIGNLVAIEKMSSTLFVCVVGGFFLSRSHRSIDFTECSGKCPTAHGTARNSRLKWCSKF